MRILVIGASKGIGLEAVRYALQREHEVRAFARSADKIPIEDARLEKLVGDALNPQDVGKAVEGVDAVIMTLGVPKDISFVVKPVTLFSQATQALIPAMEAAEVKRLLVVTGFGAGESEEKLSSLEKIPFKLILGRAYADKAVQEEMIKASALDWTIARPGILNSNRMTGKYQVLVEPATWRQGMISRADVAHFLVHAAEDGSHIHQTPAIQR